MGTWGLHPVDNDTAGDFLGKLLRPVVDQIDRCLRDSMAGEDATTTASDITRASALIVELLGYNGVWPAQALVDHLMLARDRLMELRENPRWLSRPRRGDDRAAAVELLDEQLMAINARLVDSRLPGSIPVGGDREDALPRVLKEASPGEHERAQADLLVESIRALISTQQVPGQQAAMFWGDDPVLHVGVRSSDVYACGSLVCFRRVPDAMHGARAVHYLACRVTVSSVPRE